MNNEIIDKRLNYHKMQAEKTYRNTVFFEEFINEFVSFGQEKYLELASGAGANLEYFAQKHPNAAFTGIDYDQELIKVGGGIVKSKNACLEYGDWYHLDKKYINQFEGIISLQTLSWLPEYKEPIKKACELQPRWIAMSSLFYEGKINYTISLENYERPLIDKPYTKHYYNIYAIPLIKELFSRLGYNKFYYKPFEIDIDIEKPNDYDIGTYTVTTKEEKRLQVSGAMLLPWYFILAMK